MPLQLKRFDNLNDANQFLKSLAPEALKDFKTDETGHQYILLYSTDHQFHRKKINQQTSSRVIDLLAQHADHAWSDIDAEAGDESLPMAISILINQTLAYYFPDDHPLHQTRSTISAPELDTTITPDLINLAQGADAWRVYIIKLNQTAYDQASYGYIIATYYRDDSDFHIPTVHLSFLDNAYHVHGNAFILDAHAAPQWQLLPTKE